MEDIHDASLDASLDAEDEEQIQVQFVTKIEDPALHVSDVPIFVPMRLTRIGLSEIINALLELGS